MHYLLLVIPALIAGYYSLSLILALAEKDYLRGDMIPGSPPPESWKSAYLEGKQAEAAQLGLIHAGYYQTAPHSSVVKGYMRLYVTESHNAIVALISARIGGLELKKTLVRTRLSEQRVIETNDCASTADPTGGVEKTTRWCADLVELLATHEARLQAETLPATPLRPETAFALYEQIEVDRGQRMVDRKLARWTDPSRSTIRRTIKGALGTLRANKALTDDIVKREKQRLATEKQQGPPSR